MGCLRTEAVFDAMLAERGYRLPGWLDRLRELRNDMGLSRRAMRVFATEIKRRSDNDNDFAMAFAHIEDAVILLAEIHRRENEREGEL